MLLWALGLAARVQARAARIKPVFGAVRITSGALRALFPDDPSAVGIPAHGLQPARRAVHLAAVVHAVEDLVD